LAKNSVDQSKMSFKRKHPLFVHFLESHKKDSNKKDKFKISTSIHPNLVHKYSKEEYLKIETSEFILEGFLNWKKFIKNEHVDFIAASQFMKSLSKNIHTNMTSEEFSNLYEKTFSHSFINSKVPENWLKSLENCFII
jgi:hypothetical protein